MRKLLIQPRVKRELAEIWDHIAVDSPTSADAMLTRLQAAMYRLCEFPQLGHTRRDVTLPGYKFYTERPYVIAYRYSRVAVTVVAVVHGARDSPRLFRGS